MAITIQCQCGRLMSVDEALGGQPTRCPSCGRRHLIPEPPRPTAPQFADTPCVECGAHLVDGSAYCHQCGLPIEATAGLADATPPARRTPPIRVSVPIAMPLSPAGSESERAADSDGADLVIDELSAVHPSRASRDPFDGSDSGAPFAQSKLRENAFGRASLTAASMAMLVGVLAIVFSVPAMGRCGAETVADAPVPLLNLVRGLNVIGLLFAGFGVLAGFFGMFAWRSKLAPAVWGFILSLVFFALLSASHRRVTNVIRAVDRQSRATSIPYDGDAVSVQTRIVAAERSPVSSETRSDSE